MFESVQGRVDTVNRVMQENLAGMRLVKAFLRRDYEEERFMKANQGLATMTRKTFRFVETSMPILLFVMNLSLIFILWFGNIQSVAGETDVGDVVAIVNYALRITMSISMFSFIILAFSRMKASSERLREVLAVDIELAHREDVQIDQQITKGKVSFQDVSFTYPSMRSEERRV